MCVVHSQQKNARHVMPAESIVEIKDLRFAYADRPLLKGIDLAIRKGQVVGIMGASGSGKSTLLRLIGGQLVPGGGYVKVAGKTVHELSRDDLYKLRRKMGMQFQAGGLFTDLSVYENIAFQMREHTDLPETMIRDLVLMKLAAVGLRGAAQLMPAELSGACRAASVWRERSRWIPCSSCTTNRLPASTRSHATSSET